MQNAMKVIQAHLDAASDLAINELERRARQVLKRSPKLSFCMAMGSASFYWDGEPMDDNDRAYFKPVFDLLDEFNSALSLTGYPMRIDSADAPITKVW